jgi:hypothetical protein
MSIHHAIRIAMVASLLAATTVAAHAAETTHDVNGRAGSGVETPASKASAEASAAASANAKADAEKLRRRIEETAARTSARSRAKAESELSAAEKKIEGVAHAEGEAVVAARLAAEFGTSAAELLALHEATDASWGGLTIAHALAANAKTGVTAAQLLDWKHDGMGWGTIAAGLGLDLGSVVSGVKAETRVAAGLARPDGKIAPMTGAGARAGADVGLRAGAASGHGVGTSVGAGLGAGAGLKLGK